MLYSSWRKENSDLIKDCQAYQERFEQVKNAIGTNVNAIQKYLINQWTIYMNNAKYNNFDNDTPNAEHINKQDGEVNQKPGELFGCFDPGKTKQHKQYDLPDDIGIFPRHNDNEELLIKRLSNGYAL